MGFYGLAPQVVYFGMTASYCSLRDWKINKIIIAFHQFCSYDPAAPAPTNTPPPQSQSAPAASKSSKSSKQSKPSKSAPKSNDIVTSVLSQSMKHADVKSKIESMSDELSAKASESNLSREENMSISGKEARYMMMQKLSRQSQVFHLPYSIFSSGFGDGSFFLLLSIILSVKPCHVTFITL